MLTISTKQVHLCSSLNPLANMFHISSNEFVSLLMLSISQLRSAGSPHQKGKKENDKKVNFVIMVLHR